MPHHGRVRRWWPFVLVVAVCAPGLLCAFDWLENSDVLRYAEMSTGRGTDAPWSYRVLVPWLASLLPLAPRCLALYVEHYRRRSRRCAIDANVERVAVCSEGNRVDDAKLFGLHA